MIDMPYNKKVVRSFDLLITYKGVREALIYMQLRSRLELSSLLIDLAETILVIVLLTALTSSYLTP